MEDFRPIQTTRSYQAPERPSQFGVQVATAPQDEGSVSRGGVWSPRLCANSQIQGRAAFLAEVLRTNPVFLFGRWHPARWIHTDVRSYCSLKRRGSFKPPRTSFPLRVPRLSWEESAEVRSSPTLDSPLARCAPRGNRPSELSRISVTHEMAMKSTTCRTCSRACGAGGATFHSVVV